MTRTILAIDPGTTESGWVLFENNKVLISGKSPNLEVRAIIRSQNESCDVAIEMIASYGMPVGKEVFETCVWIGRFIENCKVPVKLVYRKDVKIYLCGSMKAKDGNIRQAIIDKLGKQGTKKEPGPTYGVSGDAWNALAVAIVVNEL